MARSGRSWPSSREGTGSVSHIIGTDGGLRPFPIEAKDILIAPAERYDVVVDFSGATGTSFVMSNDGAAPFPDGGDVVPDRVMLFTVSRPLSGTEARCRRDPGLETTSVPLASRSGT